ncbi:PulJ/GspJ family protein [Aestuariivirga sp.]|uniref:PulJ/GspJ family protein n=1 Tax=Aestuariivirga sp. TaxID=2650926 RepID=UPI003BAD3A14
MITASPSAGSRQSGFTLLEVLAGLILASLILVSLNLAMTAVNKGVARTRTSLGQQAGIATAIDIFGRDVARIAKIRRGEGEAFGGYLFDGRAGSVIYPLREDAGVTAPGLYLVRLSLREDKGLRQLIRERSPLALAGKVGTPKWRDPVVLLQGPYEISFAYRAPSSGSREWSDTWDASSIMPQQIRLTIGDVATGRLRVPGFVQSLAIDSEVECASRAEQRCGTAGAEAKSQ